MRWAVISNVNAQDLKSLKFKRGVYAILGPKDKLYIGSTARNFYDRLISHISSLRRGKHSSIHLQRAWNKHGESSFKFMVLEELDDPALILETERAYILKTRSDKPRFGYNVSRVRGNRLGHVQSLRTRAKISRALLGKSKPKGFRENLRTSRAGSGNPNFGKKQTREHVLARTRRNNKRVIRSDGSVYASLKEAAADLGVAYQSVSQALRKGYRCRGFTFKYA